MDAQLQVKIAEYLNGTANSASDAAERFNVTDDEVLEAIIAQEIECCECCGWWVEVCELQDGKDGEQVCQQCSDDEGED